MLTQLLGSVLSAANDIACWNSLAVIDVVLAKHHAPCFLLFILYSASRESTSPYDDAHLFIMGNEVFKRRRMLKTLGI